MWFIALRTDAFAILHFLFFQSNYYRAQAKFGEGNVSTGICLPTGGGGLGNMKYIME